jgi:hypothetical protein
LEGSGAAAIASLGTVIAGGAHVISCDKQKKDDTSQNNAAVDEGMIYASALRDASLLTQKAHVHLPRSKVESLLSRRALQKNIGERESFTPSAHSKEEISLGVVASAVRDRMLIQPSHLPAVFVVDSSEDDFGSRANFGRGHDAKELANGCPTSYDVFLRRISNVAMNRLNEPLAQSVCVLGSIDSADLTAKVHLQLD